MHHHLHPVLAQLRSTELGRTADNRRARRTAKATQHSVPVTVPIVTEVPLKLTPVERDPFLDGLGGADPVA